MKDESKKKQLYIDEAYPGLDANMKQLIEELRPTIEKHNEMRDTANERYAAAIENIQKGGESNADRIEKLLDGLLDNCKDERFMVKYQAICGLLMDLNPELAKEYVELSRSVWNDK